MFNLLVSACEDDWNNPSWVISKSRFLEYTDDNIKERFKNLSEDVINTLKTIPTFFMYEDYHRASAKIGQITEIQRRQTEIKITYAFNPAIKEIPYERLRTIYRELDIRNKFEPNRTHWAIKDVNLIETLQQIGLLENRIYQSQKRPPKVFISYSWDSPEHKLWVSSLATWLRQNGIDIILDQWHVRGGEDLITFMERSIGEADRVIIICTENYAQKAKERSGGVGYENTLLTNELIKNLGSYKFIPVIKQTNTPYTTPSSLSTRLYYDLSGGQNYQDEARSLMMELHNISVPIPPLGRNPFSL
ncbi:TPA: toll/interleukin-1 receptor domain-containing protein [Serratia marcescens]|uniref:toll/interleukin-1 receptor domain-containing protein n=1 Tax=Serratia ureilytica TaxID=300181 RepID=UPI00063151BF|nr:toll/interleukin-1 receptor domain-containing protein [Serratia ureilytica]KKO57334.1 TIR domain protein [Serratia ureilytica]HBH6975597.1 toll/interleukin-1 receptor domain-containing protein [Serratia marcescens]HEJ7972313.1 toll/interleukin-1 receptor domain-containing protein [Serratia marcescens]